MPLEGIRAWIGEVERKLGMRTRVFLVLATIAIGGAGGAIYLALDTRDDAVSESDVRALQEELEEQIAAGGAGSALPELESRVQELELDVAQLRSQRGRSGASSGSGDSAREGASSATHRGSSAADRDEAADGSASAKSELPHLLEQAEREGATVEAGK